jgi:subtilisin
LRRVVLIIPLLAFLAVAMPGSAAAAQGDQSYIVVYKSSVSSPDTVTAKHERDDGFDATFKYGHAIKGFAAKLSPGQLKKVQGDPDVAFVSRDGTVHAVGNDPLAAGDLAPTGVRRIGAATTSTAHQPASVNVAVIDTGVDLTHPDLNATSGTNCVGTGAAQDDNGHGTHVAGTIGARNTGSGVVGVAPGTHIYAVKVLNSQGSGTWSQVICGIDWVRANAAADNIKVANMSLGGSGSNDNNCGNTNSDALHKAICAATSAGVTFSIAAGNSGTNEATSTPAAYPEVLTVTAESDSDGAPGATGGAPTCRTGERDDRYATFSNYAVAGTEINHTIAAPGVCIYSTWLGGGYNTISGTSMATPHMTGAVALCFGSGTTAGHCAGETPAQVIQTMRSDAQAGATSANGFTGDPLHPVTGRYYGYLVDVPRSAGDPVAPANVPPTASFTVTCTGRACTFDGNGSSDPDGGAIQSWSWSFGDGTTGTGPTPSHTFSAVGTYTVTLTVTDNDGGATGTSSQSVAAGSPITLQATVTTTGRTPRVNLSWSPSTSGQVQIIRNGSVIATTSNASSYTDNSFGKNARGTYTYSIRQVSTNTTSSSRTVSF